MMHLKLSLYFFLTLFISCSVFQNNNKKSQQLNELEGLNNYQKKPLVKMRKTPCFGKCPYFEVSIFDDGLIKYEGFKFVDRIGLHSSKINKKQVALIEDFIRRIDFFSFDEVYDARVTDLPSIIIEINLNGEYHKVKGRYKIPEKFKLFTKFIDDLILGLESWDQITN